MTQPDPLFVESDFYPTLRVEAKPENAQVLALYDAGFADGLRAYANWRDGCCQFCGNQGRVVMSVIDGHDYYNIGCETRGCFGSVHSQGASLPFEKAAEMLHSWNTRLVKSGDTK